MTKNLSNNPDVLCIVGKANKYGSGHYRRMQALMHDLEKHNLKCVIIDDEKKITCAGENLKVKMVILDKRDDNFPEPIFNQNNAVLFAVDNRGEGRKSATHIWDTLPHPDMSKPEVIKALQNFLLSPTYKVDKSKSTTAVISFTENIENITADENTLIHKPNDYSEDFNERLLNATTVYTYFGQTLFESIYLGKNIVLYGISPYHEKLARWFVNFWKFNEAAHQNLDGSGYKRLSDRILSLI